VRHTYSNSMYHFLLLGNSTVVRLEPPPLHVRQIGSARGITKGQGCRPAAACSFRLPRRKIRLSFSQRRIVSSITPFASICRQHPCLHFQTSLPSVLTAHSGRASDLRLIRLGQQLSLFFLQIFFATLPDLINQPSEARPTTTVSSMLT
jgi:hypothetical protein